MLRSTRLLALAAAFAAPAAAAGPYEGAPAPPAPADIPAVEAVVVVERFGEFRIRFLPEAAPNHVAAFLSLAADGFYDGLSFHRVIPGFLVQTGDPASRDEDLQNDGAGGAPFSLPAEPGGPPHRRGTVSMAWRGDRPGTASSQWFVALADLPEVDGHATPIGEVVDGMDTVDRISQVSTHRNRNPLHRVVIQDVRLEPAGVADPAGAAPAVLPAAEAADGDDAGGGGD